MKRTYKFNEIAGRIGKTREVVRGWSNYYREFLPTKAFGGSQRYTEEAIEIFEIISKLSDANKPPRFIKEHLQEMRQKAIIALNDEKPLPPTSTNVPDSNLPLSVDNAILPSVMNNSSLQLSKETMELSSKVQLLTQKIKANKFPRNLKDHLDDLNQKVGISSTAGGRLLSPMMDHSNSQFVQLSNEVAELSNIIHTLKQKVIEVSNVTEEVTELRNVIQILTQHITDLFEQDIRSEVATTLELLHRQIEGVFVEVIGLKNVIQTVQQKVTEASGQDLKGEILTATTELLNQRFEGVSEDVKNLRNEIHLKAQKVTELQNVIQTVQQKVMEASEQDLKGEILTATTELLNQRYEGVSEDVKNLQNEIHLKAQKVTELQNVIQTVQQKVTEASEQDLKGEILTATTELLNQRFEGVSEDVKNLRNEIHLKAQKVTELQNVIQTVQQKVTEVSEQDPTQKVSERLEQEIRSEMLATAESLNKRYDDISQQLTSQQRLLEKISKMLGF
ncbi:hypothetical protein [Paenibacillus sp. V4I7]|uniref:hypothetical protein n=1 Tax=Paenibacillus sp. V4I7 TaxID=3042307 RepID=UPI002783169A|nr:hypothetical protein [Paenibacillus sp. V4I7]MDQ0902900.1 prefoldin subunit 5/DNA-binding transcriptional MerR regulator [Paenibacillus sp. V4I7]